MKNSHMILGAVGIGAVGYLAYKYFGGKSAPQTIVSPYAYPNNAYGPTQGGQPSEQYPVTPIVPPRVDNSNQPWYGGNRNLAVPSSANPAPTSLQSSANDVAAGASIVSSLSSIWDDLGVGDMFSSGGNNGTVAVSSPSDEGNFNWSSLFG